VGPYPPPPWHYFDDQRRVASPRRSAARIVRSDGLEEGHQGGTHESERQTHRDPGREPLVKGKKVTSFFSIKDDMVNAGGEWFDREVVMDGNLITSRKPDDLPAFCREIVRALSKTS
jgi:putative intracellular protease/amidase